MSELFDVEGSSWLSISRFCLIYEQKLDGSFFRQIFMLHLLSVCVRKYLLLIFLKVFYVLGIRTMYVFAGELKNKYGINAFCS